MLCGWERDTGLLGTGRGKASQEQRTDRGKIRDIRREKENWGRKLPFLNLSMGARSLPACPSTRFPKLITAAPRIPLQERNSRYITGDVRGALQEEVTPLHSRSPLVHSCSPNTSLGGPGLPNPQLVDPPSPPLWHPQLLFPACSEMRMLIKLHFQPKLLRQVNK